MNYFILSQKPRKDDFFEINKFQKWPLKALKQIMGVPLDLVGKPSSLKKLVHKNFENIPGYLTSNNLQNIIYLIINILFYVSKTSLIRESNGRIVIRLKK